MPFTATSASGISTTQMATYTILPAPAAPIFSPLQSWQVNEGQPISFTAFAVDPHNPTFVLPTRLPDGSLSPYPTTQPTVTYSVSGLPPGASFDPDTALFSWTPANHQNGTYNVVFTATNDGYGGPLSTIVTVPITVLIVNHAPVVTPIANITLDGRPAVRPGRAGDRPRRQRRDAFDRRTGSPAMRCPASSRSPTTAAATASCTSTRPPAIAAPTR